ncbi:MAG: hypothetical protein AAF518_27835 [Spirochaetota bacterium]
MEVDVDFFGRLDRLSVAVSRSNKTETYSAKRRKRYHDFAQEQIRYLELQIALLL